MACNGTVLALSTSDGRRPRVALVGGTPASAMVAGVLIEQFGCTTVNAPTGPAVLALLNRHEPIDLVVMDVSLPAMDAIVATQLVQLLGPRKVPPVIALTDEHDRVSLTRARVAGFATAVAKPYSPRELYGAMRLALVGPVTVVSGSA